MHLLGARHCSRYFGLVGRETRIHTFLLPVTIPILLLQSVCLEGKEHFCFLHGMPDLNKALHIEKSSFKASALLSTTVLNGSLNHRKKKIHTSACSGKKQRWTDFFFNLDKVLFYFWIPTVPCSSVVVVMLFSHLWLRSLLGLEPCPIPLFPLPDRYSHSIAHESISSVLVELITVGLIFFLGTVTLSQSLLVHRFVLV